MVKYYPVLLNVSGLNCQVVGGGEVAARKVAGLLECGAAVRIIGPEACLALQQFVQAGKITWEKRPYRQGDLKGAGLVIAATDDSQVNLAASEDAHRAGIPVNVVDDAVKSSFILPAVLRRGDIIVAVSTSGRSPALARKLRTRLEQEFGEEYDTLTRVVDDVRQDLKRKGLRISSEVWQQALDVDQLIVLIREGRLEAARELILDRIIAAGVPNL